jgi:hypothetical protein
MPVKSFHWALAVAVAAMPLADALAGSKPVECYRKTYRPAVYDTVYEHVQVHGAYVRTEVTPAIYGTRKVRRLVSPERVTYRVIPAEYDIVREKVLLYPGRKVARTIPAVVDTVHHKVKVDGGYAWEYRRINGKMVLCKVKRKATWRTVAETVVVKPARTVYETVPAEYGYRDSTVLVRDARKEAVIVPAVYDYELERVVIQPEIVRSIEVPASYQTVAREVLVSEGSSDWERVAIPRHCR